ncbi:MAG: hypothetical protein P8X96_01920 [Desulfobacteraceae bacterium]|jgi:hypothetical protein
MMLRHVIAVVLGAAVLLLPAPSLWAGEADVIEVRVRKGTSDSYTFHVTVQHKDTGWDHYADKWEIVGPGGVVLGTRVLMHPHVEEQPFARSLSGVKIPTNIKSVTVRAHDKVHGWGGKTKTAHLP